VHLVLILALLSMSVSGPTTRFAAASALAVVVWRIAFAWPVLAGAALLRRETWPLRQGAAAGFFLTLHWLSWTLAVQRTSIASASLLVSTGVLWAALLSRPLLGETVSRRQWGGLALALGGVVLVVTGKQTAHHSVLGDVFALIGACAWVGYTFVGRRARQQASFWAYTSTVYLTTALLTLGAAVALRTTLVGFDGHTWLALIALALFPTLLGHGSCNYLLRHMPPARLSLFTLSEPVLATLYAWPLFGEVPRPQMVIGGIATLVGVGLGVRER
jgi:drug/metabolite transporter (DMT)-like permease